MKDIAYACALYPLASYQLTAATLRAALTAAADSRRRSATAAAPSTAGLEALAAPLHSHATGGSR